MSASFEKRRARRMAYSICAGILSDALASTEIESMKVGDVLVGPDIKAILATIEAAGSLKDEGDLADHVEGDPRIEKCFCHDCIAKRAVPPT